MRPALALDLKDSDLDPGSLYDLGLLLFVRRQYMAAATALRHGFIENGYIAEILCGMPRPLPLAIWHGSNLAEPEPCRRLCPDVRAAVAP